MDNGLCANCEGTGGEVKADRVQDELTKLYQLFSSKELPDMASHTLIKAPEIPSTKWSWSNQFIMLMEHTNDARGFRQWEEAGRRIKKGSHAIYILAPAMKTMPYLYCPTCKKEIVPGEDVEHVKTHETRTRSYMRGFLAVPVFRYEDTYGKPLPKYKPRNPPLLADVAKAWGYRIEYRNLPRAYGNMNPETKLINLASEDPDTMFHELAHAAYFRRHPDEFHKHSDKLNEHEAIAELSAATLARLYGYNADGFAWNYLAHYSGGRSPEKVGAMVMHVMNETHEVVADILNAAQGLPTSVELAQEKAAATA